MITLIDVKIGFENKAIVEDLNWSFSDKKISIIKGPNGSGKSTLLRTINGAQCLIAGKIIFDTENPKSSYLPQSANFNFDFPISVFDFVSMGLVSKSLFFSCHKKIVASKLAEMDLTLYSGHYINELSGGLVQRCLFARMLLEESSLLLLDDPFSFIDESNKIFLVNKIKELSLSKTILMVLHDKEDISLFDSSLFELSKDRRGSK